MNKKTKKILGISLLFSLILLVVVKYYIDNNNLNKDYRVTIGFVYGYETLIKSGYNLYFYYYVDENKYSSEYIIYNNPIIYLNKRYFVLFSPSNPKNCRILLNKKVPVNITKAPPNGWDSIPE